MCPATASVSKSAAVGWAPMSSSTYTALRGRLSGPLGAAPTTTIIAIAI
jgi:hypothetical protein